MNIFLIQIRKSVRIVCLPNSFHQENVFRGSGFRFQDNLCWDRLEGIYRFQPFKIVILNYITIHCSLFSSSILTLNTRLKNVGYKSTRSTDASYDPTFLT